MKTLFLLRHAKSSWEDDSLGDFDRPLSSRGQRTAPLMGAHMAAEGFLPDIVCCSPARRAQETWELIQAALGDVPVDHDDALYLASPYRILQALAGLSDETGSALVIGHNPGMEELARSITVSGDQAALEMLRTKYPTCALAVVELDIESWVDASVASGTLKAFVRPVDLEA